MERQTLPMFQEISTKMMTHTNLKDFNDGVLRSSENGGRASL